MAAALKEVLRENIKARRLELGLTQTVAAERAGIASAYWSQIEGGKRTPDIDTIEAMAAALQTKGPALLSAEIFSANCP